ncbi:unnamed protein product [Pleuronectes platessa]|uniref:Glycosyltransferase 2-like domain-containing protein n=1 Tax=Pleuronectes platessa TaxID=8262 RepID=A0A9N7TWG7_PLEPL|nr:unnamed protein product [Pleuronectes platessa]
MLGKVPAKRQPLQYEADEQLETSYFLSPDTSSASRLSITATAQMEPLAAERLTDRHRTDQAPNDFLHADVSSLLKLVLQSDEGTRRSVTQQSGSLLIHQAVVRAGVPQSSLSLPLLRLLIPLSASLHPSLCLSSSSLSLPLHIPLSAFPPPPHPSLCLSSSLSLPLLLLIPLSVSPPPPHPSLCLSSSSSLLIPLSTSPPSHPSLCLSSASSSLSLPLFIPLSASPPPPSLCLSSSLSLPLLLLLIPLCLSSSLSLPLLLLIPLSVSPPPPHPSLCLTSSSSSLSLPLLLHIPLSASPPPLHPSLCLSSSSSSLSSSPPPVHPSLCLSTSLSLPLLLLFIPLSHFSSSSSLSLPFIPLCLSSSSSSSLSLPLLLVIPLSASPPPPHPSLCLSSSLSLPLLLHIPLSASPPPPHPSLCLSSSLSLPLSSSSPSLFPLLLLIPISASPPPLHPSLALLLLFIPLSVSPHPSLCLSSSSSSLSLPFIPLCLSSSSSLSLPLLLLHPSLCLSSSSSLSLPLLFIPLFAFHPSLPLLLLLIPLSASPPPHTFITPLAFLSLVPCALEPLEKEQPASASSQLLRLKPPETSEQQRGEPVSSGAPSRPVDELSAESERAALQTNERPFSCRKESSRFTDLQRKEGQHKVTEKQPPCSSVPWELSPSNVQTQRTSSRTNTRWGKDLRDPAPCCQSHSHLLLHPADKEESYTPLKDGEDLASSSALASDPALSLFKHWGHDLGPESRRVALKKFRYYGYNGYLSDRLSLTRPIADLRPDGCRNLSYSSDLPQLSIIFIFVNEALSVLLRSVHTAIQRTPSHLLKEIILVDDHSSSRKNPS